MPDAPVDIVAYRPWWPAAFIGERALLQATLDLLLTGEIEHIGSTAVPSLAARPVIDLMAPMHTLEFSRAAIPALRAIHYQHHPYRADVMHWFCKPSPDHRTHHPHRVPRDSPLWMERLAFRDALRRDAALVCLAGPVCFARRPPRPQALESCPSGPRSPVSPHGHATRAAVVAVPEIEFDTPRLALRIWQGRAARGGGGRQAGAQGRRQGVPWT